MAVPMQGTTSTRQTFGESPLACTDNRCNSMTARQAMPTTTGNRASSLIPSPDTYVYFYVLLLYAYKAVPLLSWEPGPT